MFCWNCGSRNDDRAAKCANCGAELVTGAAVGIVRGQRSARSKAILSFVLGLLSIFSCCVLVGIPAIVLGIVAIVQSRESEGQRSDRAYAVAGIVLGACSMAILVVMMSPWNLYRATGVQAKTSQARVNMRILRNSIEQYQLDTSMYPLSLTSLTSPVAYLLEIPKDPFLDGRSRSDFDYAVSADRTYWVLRCEGMDRAPDANLKALCEEQNPVLRNDAFLRWSYDPTNGVDSTGDILFDRTHF